MSYAHSSFWLNLAPVPPRHFFFGLFIDEDAPESAVVALPAAAEELLRFLPGNGVGWGGGGG